MAQATTSFYAATMTNTDLGGLYGAARKRITALVTAYDWSTDPTPYLDTFFLFGPAEHSIGEHL